MVGILTPIESVPRISRKIVPALKRFGIKTIRDLLFYFPSRYEDFSSCKKIEDVVVGEVVTVQGVIRKVTNRRTWRKKMVLTEAVIEDETGKIKALWFNQPFLVRNLREGNAVSMSGKIARGTSGIHLQNPAYEKRDGKSQMADNIHTGGLVAIYPETKGMTSKWLRFLVHSFIDLRKYIDDPLPQDVRDRQKLPSAKDALYQVHFPKSLRDAELSRRRFVFEELFLVQLRVLSERLRLRQLSAPEIPLDLALLREFVKSLPFALTDAQRRSIWEVAQDISKSRPMNRLLEGDVGSGKTVVAAAAVLLAVRSGLGVVFMAPTEILARQHLDTLRKLLLSFHVKVGLMVGAEKKVSSDTRVFVGTHALIQKNVQFENLGLVVVDEQHRFGVEQRARLANSNWSGAGGTKSLSGGSYLPHFLSMSATPIPRTIALTIYGDLDLSLLDEMPKSRKPVITKIVGADKRQAAYQFIRSEVAGGRQVFVICPKIEPSTGGAGEERPVWSQRKILQEEVKSVKAEYQKLGETVFPELRILMLHGKMKSPEKKKVMEAFREGAADILVSTSVVEVGVDIPNATVMMIEGAERFGLAQLHQFRGRVGRGENQSHCLLFTTGDSGATRRLKAVVEVKTGFELAEKDLEIRGPGDLLGVRQWGVSGMSMEGLRDPRLVREVRKEAMDILKTDSLLAKFPLLRERLKRVVEMAHPE